jgi:hypothetical protein
MNEEAAAFICEQTVAREELAARPGNESTQL